MKIHIKNGHLIDPKNNRDEKADLLVVDGKVESLLPSGTTLSDVQVINARGCIVSPGFIDLHTHLREPGFEYKETVESGTKAAAAGGFTSVCCMANTNPVNDNATVTGYILSQARHFGCVNVFPIGAITMGLKGESLAPFGELKRAGCVAFSDDGMAVQNNKLMRLALEYAKTFNMLVITHSVDAVLAGQGVMNESFTSTRLGLEGIPNEAEDIMIARDIYMAKLTGARLHIAHVSTAEGVELVKRAKQAGLSVTCEATPHHFTLTDTHVCHYDSLSKVAPPLRSEADRQAVMDGIASGVVDAIATDHAPHSILEKEEVEFDLAACGMIGLETALGLSMKLVEQGKITLPRLVELLTSNPAKIVGLEKGSLEVGADADITIFDPQASYEVTRDLFYSKSKNSPYLGMTLQGQVKTTLVGGRVVFTLPL